MPEVSIFWSAGTRNAMLSCWKVRGEAISKTGINVVDYIICNQELFRNTNYFVVKPPTYLSDHNQTVTWVGIDQTKKLDTNPGCNIEMTKLPNQYIWDNHSKNNFGESLRSQEMQKKLNEFMNSDFTNDLNGQTNL